MVDKIRIMGGDLLCQNGIEVLTFCGKLIKYFRDKELWLFTGAEIEEVPDYVKTTFDVIKTGRYVQELHQEGFPASSNQKVLRKGDDYY
jgi:hypothetical protein